MFTNFSSFMPGKAMDFNAVVAGPTVTAVGEHQDYENRLHEHADRHSPMSLYEMETMQNPHSFQRRLMNKMFTPHPEAAITSRGAEAQVQLFRRMTAPITPNIVQPDDARYRNAAPGEVTIFRRFTDTFKDAAFGSDQK